MLGRIRLMGRGLDTPASNPLLEVVSEGGAFGRESGVDEFRWGDPHDVLGTLIRKGRELRAPLLPHHGRPRERVALCPLRRGILLRTESAGP